MSEKSEPFDPTLLAAFEAGAPWWLAIEAVATTRMSRLDEEETRG